MSYGIEKNSSSKDNMIKLVFKNIINKSVTNQFISCMVVIPIFFVCELYIYIYLLFYIWMLFILI